MGGTLARGGEKALEPPTAVVGGTARGGGGWRNPTPIQAAEDARSEVRDGVNNERGSALLPGLEAPRLRSFFCASKRLQQRRRRWNQSFLLPAFVPLSARRLAFHAVCVQREMPCPRAAQQQHWRRKVLMLLLRLSEAMSRTFLPLVVVLPDAAALLCVAAAVAAAAAAVTLVCGHRRNTARQSSALLCSDHLFFPNQPLHVSSEVSSSSPPPSWVCFVWMSGHVGWV